MKKREWILFYRSFLLTMGAGFIGFSLWFAAVNYMRNEFNAALPISLFLVFNILGGFLIYHGIYGNDKKVESMANSASKHWASLVIMLIAYPVYLVLSSKGKNNV